MNGPQDKKDELVEKNHHLAILQHSMSKMASKSANSNKAEIETIDNLSKLIDTQVKRFMSVFCNR